MLIMQLTEYDAIRDMSLAVWQKLIRIHVVSKRRNSSVYPLHSYRPGVIVQLLPPNPCPNLEYFPHDWC